MSALVMACACAQEGGRTESVIAVPVLVPVLRHLRTARRAGATWRWCARCHVAVARAVPRGGGAYGLLTDTCLWKGSTDTSSVEGGSTICGTRVQQIC